MDPLSDIKSLIYGMGAQLRDLKEGETINAADFRAGFDALNARVAVLEAEQRSEQAGTLSTTSNRQAEDDDGIKQEIKLEDDELETQPVV